MSEWVGVNADKWQIRCQHQAGYGPVNLPSLIWKILHARGISSPKEIDSYLSPSLKDLRDPHSLDGMRISVDRLVQAFEQNEKICIYGDFDLDGTSGLALLLKALELLGFRQLVGYQPKRLTEGYGLHSAAIEKLHAEGVSLVVTVDVGITAVKAVERARELGVDVIITDHHLPADSLPQALAIVNPNKGTCPSGLSYLCGTGVAFYLALALRRAFRNKGYLAQDDDFDPKKLLDCFVIGTLTDLVPLVKENRSLIRHGLRELASTERIGLRVLMEELGLAGRELGSQEVAIRLAPKLNALSRMDLGLLPLDLYLVKTRTEAVALVKEVMANNEMRLKLQAEAEEEALRQAKKRAQKGYVWVYSEHFHQGVVGLVATKLSQAFQVPTFVGAVHPDKGTITGSSRSPSASGLSVLEGLNFAASALKNFGGHAAAAGFELTWEKAEEFDSRLSAHFNIGGDGQTAQSCLWYDAECCLSELSFDMMSWFSHLEPFGTDWEALVLRVRDLKITGVRELRGGHYKLEVTGRENSHHRLDALWFSPPSQHAFFQVYSLGKNQMIGQEIELLAEPQWNFFAGRKSVQLLIKDLQLMSSHQRQIIDQGVSLGL